jgi:hypothetical protein
LTDQGGSTGKTLTLQVLDLSGDSVRLSYADSIKQWALWMVEQKFDEKSFRRCA